VFTVSLQLFQDDLSLSTASLINAAERCWSFVVALPFPSAHCTGGNIWKFGDWCHARTATDPTGCRIEENRRRMCRHGPEQSPQLCSTRSPRL